MGSAIARHLLKRGRPVLGWDTEPEARNRFAAAGGTPAGGLAEMGAASVVISMVFDDRGTLDVTEGRDGLLNTLRPGAIHVVMASISPHISRRVHDAHEQRRQRYLAASVFGRPEAADAGTLLINCSGPAATFHAIEPLLEPLGRAEWVGPEPEQAMLLKLVGNSMIFTAIETLREMFAFLRAGRIEERRAKELLIDTLFPGQIFSGYAQRLIDDPDGSHMTAMARKDRRNCLAAAAGIGIELPLVSFLHDRDLP
jgi:3-hydroxyisobutyrate dehydrogenase-like beta-hydroxyacid dehydrogenase